MNIQYRSPAIGQFYAHHRVSWDEFYPSERVVFERVVRESGRLGTVLDVGGAAGGLGRALAQRFGLGHYTCIDINAQAIDAAKAHQADFPVPAEFICGDAMDPQTALRGRVFDLVTSLSCADWNLETRRIVDACWDYVAPGGRLVISLRLTNSDSVNDMTRSYQFVHFGASAVPADAERANYVVLNVRDALAMMQALHPRPGHLFAYGYWGKPSATAVTLYDQLAFTVLAVTKQAAADATVAELRLPLDLLTGR